MTNLPKWFEIITGKKLKTKENNMVSSWLDSMYVLYDEDISLLKELGIEVPEDTKLPHAKDFYLGKVTGEDYSIELFVNALPAHFYRAVIKSGESRKTYEVSTGSGTLRDFWDTFLGIAQDMINVIILKEEAPGDEEV